MKRLREAIPAELRPFVAGAVAGLVCAGLGIDLSPGGAPPPRWVWYRTESAARERWFGADGEGCRLIVELLRPHDGFASVSEGVGGAAPSHLMMISGPPAEAIDEVWQWVGRRHGPHATPCGSTAVPLTPDAGAVPTVQAAR